jgi:hypothetical protein
VTGRFLDGPFSGSLDGSFTLSSDAGSDVVAAIANDLTQEYTADAGQFRGALPPGESISPGPRIVTVYDVVDHGVYVTGHFLAQGRSGRTRYEYAGVFTAGDAT